MAEPIATGLVVCGGIVTANVRVLVRPADAIATLPGEIVVVPTSHPEYALGVMEAAGLICENGGIISHICTVALELGIPCVTEVKDATTLLARFSRVTLDADRGLIYAE